MSKKLRAIFARSFFVCLIVRHFHIILAEDIFSNESLAKNEALFKICGVLGAFC